MGKVKTITPDESNSSDLSIIISQKRHKKHKHKKHKKKKSAHSPLELPKDSVTMVEKRKSVKIRSRDDKILEKPKEKILTKLPSGVTSSPKVSSKKKVAKSGKSKDSGTSSEEERWLDAIESGKLEEVDDELKKIKPKDPKLMTARQRAMFERKTDTEPHSGVEQLLSLPTGYKEKVMTAEAIQKAALKSLKRKQLADEKREKDKKKTMDRLLKKQESKASKLGGKGKLSKRQVPLMTYKSTADGCSISLPPGVEFPFLSSKLPNISPVINCSIDGCPNPKKYLCSRTGIPLCSLECYKANLSRILA